ncbi:MAG: hypothetical protein PEPC_01691 [Peptostreptococcus russellii]
MEDKFLWGLKITDTLTMDLTSKIAIIAGGVALICFICNLAYNYLYHGANQLLSPNEDKFPDYMEIARCVALFLCLTIYTPIVKTFVGTMEVINEATSLTSDRATEFSQYMERSSSEQSDLLMKQEENALQAGVAKGEDTEGGMQKELNNKEEGSEMTGLGASVGQIARFLNPGNMAASVIHAVAAFLVAIIQVVILGISVVIVKLLVILGPFVFAFSMLPVFQKQLSVWFGTLCSVGFVFTVINILNQIMLKTFQDIYSAGGFDVIDEINKPLIYLGIDLALIGSYCSVFWLSGKIVGHGDAGRIISKTVSLVTSAATVAIAGTAMAGGVSQATNVGAAASVGKSIINHDE